MQDELNKLELIQRKLIKNYQRPDLLKCLAIDWTEVHSLKTRIEDVTKSISMKVIKNERTYEVNKQLLSSKKLKEYFKNNP